jgi:hypothetical protein
LFRKSDTSSSLKRLGSIPEKYVSNMQGTKEAMKLAVLRVMCSGFLCQSMYHQCPYSSVTGYNIWVRIHHSILA